MIALMLMSCHILVITLPSVPSQRKTLPKRSVIETIISSWVLGGGECFPQEIFLEAGGYLLPDPHSRPHPQHCQKVSVSIKRKTIINSSLMTFRIHPGQQF